MREFELLGEIAGAVPNRSRFFRSACLDDDNAYDYTLQSVASTDGMTADYYHFDHEFLGRTANRIINEVSGINRVVYDVTSKPPGTIEWE